MSKCRWKLRPVSTVVGLVAKGDTACGKIAFPAQVVSFRTHDARYCPYCGREIEVEGEDD